MERACKINMALVEKDAVQGILFLFKYTKAEWV